MTGNGFKYRTIRLSTYFLFSLPIIFSIIQYGCRENKRLSIPPAANPVSVVAPQITDLGSLADSQQPKQIFLSDVPPPFTMKVSSQYIKQAGLLGGNQNFTAGHQSGSTIVTEAQGRGFFTTYSTEDGLALDQVNCSYMDNSGNLWFGTNGGGVSKYDGKSFVNFTTLHGLANNIIWCITEDHAGNIWFGTDGSGASKYDGERFTNFSITQGLPDNVVFSIIEDKNKQIWFGTLKGGVSKYDGKNFTNYSTADGLPNNAVKIIKEDHDGKIWFGTLGGGASKFDGKTFSNFSTRQGLADDDVWCIAEDAKGFMWFGTGKGGLSKYDGSKFTNHFLFPDKPGNAIVSVLPDGQSDMWIGTTKQGVSKFHNNVITTYTTAQGLANNKVRSILEDKKGNIWISTYGSGLSKYAGDIFQNFTTEQGLSNHIVFSIAEDRQGALWLGTAGGGINKYDGNKFIELNTAQGLADNVINCLVKDHANNLWIGTSGGGVSKFDGKSFTNYTTAQGLANDIVFNILEDQKNNLWIGTSGGGVSKFDGKSFTNYTVGQGLASNVVFSIAEDRMGHLWFGTLGGGASKFDSNKFINYTIAQGLPDNVVWTIFQDKFDDLWFGTQNGLGLLQAAKGAEGNFINGFTDKRFRKYTIGDGLPDNFVTQVIQGLDNKIYVGTNRGICELLPDSSQDNRQWGVGKIYNAQTGYPVRDVNAGQNAMFKDLNGIIWAGTGSDKTGLVRFDPKALVQQHQSPPLVIIKNVKINNETVSWSNLDAETINQQPDSAIISTLITNEVNTYGRALTSDERDSLRNRYQKISFSDVTKWNAVPLKLKLPYDFNEVGFDFSAIETGKNFRVKYQYKLSGYDKDWTPPNYQTSVNFGNIYEGTHTFMVKAQSPEGIWSEPVSYTFTVRPPWWRTWWMYIIYSIVIIGFILILFWWNNRRIISQKNILQHKVSIATRQLSQENQKVNAQKKQIEETLSELKSTQAQLIQSEKMASLGELTAGIAHEIKNPLNFVNNFSELNKELLAEMDEEITKGNYEEVKEISKSIRENEEKINQHGKRADDIVKGMLQHSRVSEGQKVLTNINALADEYLRLSYHACLSGRQGFLAKDPKDSMNKSINVTIRTDFDENVGTINIVPQDIGRVLLNLYNNAFYAVNEKSKNLKTKDSQNPDALFYEPTVSVSTKKLNDKIEIKVSDNGNGIPQKVLDKIFQPFFTTKPTGQGTGLGLSLSYDIVKAHGGEISVGHNGLPWRIPSSEWTPLEEKVETLSADAAGKEGEGSEFIIQLPVK